MPVDKRYKGIFYMLLAALGFSVMGGAAKSLKGSLEARATGFLPKPGRSSRTSSGTIIRPPVQSGGKFLRLAFRGLMAQ